MRRPSFFLAAAMLSLLTAGCAHHLDKADELPKGAEYVPPPMFDQFDSAQITADAKKLLAIGGPVGLVSMNSVADDKDLAEILKGLKDVRLRGEPAVCVSRDARFVTDSIGRALEKYPKVDLTGLTLVVAAPNEPSKEFPEFLAKHKIQYHYLHVKPNGPYGQ